MPPLPRGLVKRRVMTKRGNTVVYYWRRKLEGGRDQRMSLGDDYSRALARFKELQDNPPPASRNDAAIAEPPPPSPPLTVEAFSRRWLDEYAASQRTPRGRSQAQQRFRDYLWPVLGSTPLSDLTSADIRRLSAVLEGRSVGLVTRRRLLEDLRCCLYYATDEAKVLDRSPWVKGKRGRGGLLPTAPEKAPNPLNELELAEVLRVAPEKRWRPVLQLLAFTGLRWGELRALTWKDVRDTPYPHLLVSKQHTGGPTKSGKFREVPLGAEAREILESLSQSSRLVVELPETASWIRRHVISNSWVKDFHVHRLRHTFGCRYLERGGRIETLQRILGHSSVRQTEQYAKIRPEIVAAEMARIDGTVDGTVPNSEPAKAVTDGSATGIRTPV